MILTNTQLLASTHFTNINDVEEKTYVLYGEDEIVRSTLELMEIITTKIDNCIDANSPSMFIIPTINGGFHKLKKRGIKLRFITELTKENIIYCKEIMKFAELRHLDEVKGNFAIADDLYYRASAKTSQLSPPPLLICSSLRAFVEQQQYFYDMLWKKGIPAKQRLKEIEEGTKREFIDTIQDPAESLDLIHKTISSASEEIMIMFPTIRSFQVYEKEGILNLIKRQLENRITVRICYLGKIIQHKEYGKRFHPFLIFIFNILVNYLLAD